MQTLLQDLHHMRHIASQQCGLVEPQARKDAALEDPSVAGWQRLKLPCVQKEPVQFPVKDAPDDVLLHAAAAVRVQLYVQVIAHGTGRDLRCQFRGAFDVFLFNNTRRAAT